MCQRPTTRQRDLPAIGNLHVDTSALIGIAHRCCPEACAHGGCCGDYDVIVAAQELDDLIGMMPSAATYAPHLRDGNGYLNVFEEEDNGEFSIDKSEAGICVFGYADAHDHTWCALHTAAMDLDLPLARAKPKACRLWPLALTDDQPLVLSVQDDALDFACNRQRSADRIDLDAGIAAIVRSVFGDGFYTDLCRRIATGG